MSFTHYILESEFDLSPSEIKILNDINKQCSKYLKEVAKHHQPFYRGIKKAIGAMGKKKIRNDRRPRDASRAESQLANALLAKHKLPPRSQVLFATTSKTETSQYGDTCYIFPIGNYNYFWFEDIDDMHFWTHYTNLYMHFPDGFDTNNLKDIKSEIDSAPLSPKERKHYEEFLDSFDPKTSTIPVGMENEISIHSCKEYFYIADIDENKNLLDAIFNGIL
jgi:hypothetical protein